jgi:hypothetical protein
VNSKKFLLLALVTLAGCQPSLTPNQVELLGECFSCAAYEVIRAESAASLAPQPPQKCCGKCKGGLVRSGDGLEWVSCPCDDSCPCKTNRQFLIPPKTLP